MRIIAHRCGPTIYPEQTMASARLALKNGADYVEVDVRYSKDKVIVCSHDANTQRVFGADKLVKDMTAEEFLSLRQIKDTSYAPHLFEDYLKEDVKPLLIHVKEVEVLDDLLSLLSRYDYLDSVVLGLMNAQAVKKVKEYNSSIKVLAFMPKVEDIDDFASAGANYIRLWEDWLCEETVSKVKARSVELWIMTGTYKNHIDSEVGVTTKEDLKNILSFSPDGILINDIIFLQKALEK